MLILLQTTHYNVSEKLIAKSLPEKSFKQGLDIYVPLATLSFGEPRTKRLTLHT